MNAGKSTLLLQASHNYHERGMKTYLITAGFDKRAGKGKIGSRIGIVSDADIFGDKEDMFHKIELRLEKGPCSCVLIDEAQFFNKSIIKDLKYLNSKNIKVIIAGLDKDYLNKPFGCMEEIIALSDSVIRLKAVCNHCSKEATYSHRSNMVSQNQFLIGNKNFYEALCETCFQKINFPNGQ